jgi:hypothetical protein
MSSKIPIEALTRTLMYERRTLKELEEKAKYKKETIRILEAEMERRLNENQTET